MVGNLNFQKQTSIKLTYNKKRLEYYNVIDLCKCPTTAQLAANDGKFMSMSQGRASSNSNIHISDTVSRKYRISRTYDMMNSLLLISIDNQHWITIVWKNRGKIRATFIVSSQSLITWSSWCVRYRIALCFTSVIISLFLSR